MKLLFACLLAVSCLAVVLSTPSDDSECAGHMQECDPDLEHGYVNAGKGQCCLNFEWCMGHQLEGGQLVHKCTPILPGK
ncbi:hypothetical protein V1264_015868 [Littorina saxatilis]|uniref:Uncharacterized protein n=1 Tax=Littorina saxatilis TaxID=31220 RepID=A0AAN9BMX0_9CAEN